MGWGGFAGISEAGRAARAKLCSPEAAPLRGKGVLPPTLCPLCAGKGSHMTPPSTKRGFGGFQAPASPSQDSPPGVSGCQRCQSGDEWPEACPCDHAVAGGAPCEREAEDAQHGGLGENVSQQGKCPRSPWRAGDTSAEASPRGWAALGSLLADSHGWCGGLSLRMRME